MQYTTHIHQSEIDNTEVHPPTGTVNNDIQMQHVLTDNANGNEAQVGYSSKLEDIKQMGLT
jgi:hypothetical protein